MANVVINGKSYSGNNITISNGKIMINGTNVTPDEKEINITVNGNIDALNVDVCNTVSVEGDVRKISTMSGSVDITGNVSGNVDSMSGNINCQNIGGDVSSMSGTVKYKR